MTDDDDNDEDDDDDDDDNDDDDFMCSPGPTSENYAVTIDYSHSFLSIP